LILLSKLDCNSGDKVIILSMISNSLLSKVGITHPTYL